jgi:hypothetical protein
MENALSLNSLLLLNDVNLNQTFELKTPHLLGVKVQDRVWLKNGAMVAYFGNIKYIREGFLEQGLNNLFKKFISG